MCECALLPADLRRSSCDGPTYGWLLNKISGPDELKALREDESIEEPDSVVSPRAVRDRERKIRSIHDAQL